jgi:hypothetical protein
MRPSDVSIRELRTVDECLRAIDRIESDPANTVGGEKAFYSGRTTELNITAKKKIEAIEAKLIRFADKSPDE